MRLFKIINSIILLFFLCNCSIAQNRFTDGIIKVGGKSYLCKKGDYNTIQVRNSANKLYYQKMKIPSNWDDLSIIDCGPLNQVADVTKEIFAPDRIKQLAAQPPLTISFYVNDVGKILELDFTINENSDVSPGEISKLEDELKSKITLIYTKDKFKGANFISFHQILSFQKINENIPLCGN